MSHDRHLRFFPFLIVLIGTISIALSPPVKQMVMAMPQDFYYLTVDTLSDSVLKKACTASPDDCNLRGAIQFANETAAGSEVYINIPAGTYYIMQFGIKEDFNISGDFDIRERTITLHGAGISQTILDGQTIDRVLDIQNGTVTIENLKITQGVAPASNYGGGAIRNYNLSTLKIHNVLIEGNSVEGNGYSDLGGGISNYGVMTIEDTTITANSACFGGGVFSRNDTLNIRDSEISNNNSPTTAPCGLGGGISTTKPSSEVHLIRVSLHDNTARSGGGIYYDGDTLEVTDSAIYGNQALEVGAGVDCSGALTLQGSTLSGNTGALVGGGLMISGPLIANNDTFYSNTTSSGGGGIALSGSTTSVLNHVTIYGNTGPDAGAALDSYGANTISLHNTILGSGAAGKTCYIAMNDTYIDLGYNLSSDHSCGFSTGEHDMIDTDPLLLSLANYGGPTPTMGFQAGSPAIDAADPLLTLYRDQRHYYRPVNGIADIGAFEYDSFPLPLVSWLPLILK